MLVSSLALLATLVPALAGHSQPAHIRHRQLAVRQQEQQLAGAHVARANAGHADAHRAIKRTVNKRGQQCRPRGQSKPVLAAAPSDSVSSASSASAASSAAASPSAWSSPAAASPAAPSAAPTSEWSEPSPAPSSAAAPAPSPTQNTDSGSAGNSAHWGVLAVDDSTCGWSNADDNNPNGSQDWLNCGLNGAGWSPPQVSIDQLIASELDASGVFAPCASYIDKFKQYGAEFNVYPIMLASFAMQESTCNPGATGGGGEAGLMQIAPPNCESWANCWDVDYNIRRGAQLFRQMIDANGGNVLAAIGAYNGWRKGMTVGDATAARWTGNCRNQNNLDYIYQYCNGWMQNKNAHSMGTYFNLAEC